MTTEDKLVYSASEVQRLLALSRHSVYEGMRTGAIPSISVGRRRLVPKAALEKLLTAAGQRQDLD